MQFVKLRQSKFNFSGTKNYSLFENYVFLRFVVTKTAKIDKEQTSTCPDESKPTENTTNDGNGDQPPEKKKRLSNKEYKKMMKGQNKVSSGHFSCFKVCSHKQ